MRFFPGVVILLNGQLLPTILSVLKEKKNAITLQDVVFKGDGEILCAECGGPTPGVGVPGGELFQPLNCSKSSRYLKKKNPMWSYTMCLVMWYTGGCNAIADGLCKIKRADF